MVIAHLIEMHIQLVTIVIIMQSSTQHMTRCDQDMSKTGACCIHRRSARETVRICQSSVRTARIWWFVRYAIENVLGVTSAWKSQGFWRRTWRFHSTFFWQTLRYTFCHPWAFFEGLRTFWWFQWIWALFGVLTHFTPMDLLNFWRYPLS